MGGYTNTVTKMSPMYRLCRGALLAVGKLRYGLTVSGAEKIPDTGPLSWPLGEPQPNSYSLSPLGLRLALVTTLMSVMLVRRLSLVTQYLRVTWERLRAVYF
jgi:hypothetical protein